VRTVSRASARAPASRGAVAAVLARAAVAAVVDAHRSGEVGAAAEPVAQAGP
jgi:hypothetical protein